MVLMIIFVPVQIADVFRETPAIGSHQAALIVLLQLPFQFVFILWDWMVSGFNVIKQNT